MNEEKDQGIVRTILHHEITWIVFILVVGWSFVTQVVLPINRLEIDVAQTRIDLAKLTADHDTIIVMQGEITAIEQEHKTIEANLNKTK